MNYPEHVKSVLWGIIAKMSQTPWQFAKNPGTDFTRKRKLCLEDLLRFLVSMGSGTTNHELLKYFDFNASVLSNSAFYQQRQKLPLFAFQHLLYEFNSDFPFVLYKGVYQLAGCDGSEFNIFRNPNDPDTFHPPSGRSAKGFNMIHTIPLYDILSKRYLDCVIQPGRKKNEFRAICELVDRFPYRSIPIFIGDRGFSSYNFYAHATEKGALFLVRAKDINTKRILNLETLPDCLDQNIEIILTRTQSKKKRKYPESPELYRFISPEVSFDYIERGSSDEYTLPLRIVRLQVAEGIFENIFTNLPADEFPPEEIKHLYHLRWDVETSFRDLKHTLGASNFHSKTPEYIEQEIWAHLILYNFCTIITGHVVITQKDTKYVYQVNLSMAMKISHHFINLRGGKPPPDVEALIGSYTLPIRPGRNFARQHRFQLPSSFCYRFI